MTILASCWKRYASCVDVRFQNIIVFTQVFVNNYVFQSGGLSLITINRRKQFMSGFYQQSAHILGTTRLHHSNNRMVAMACPSHIFVFGHKGAWCRRWMPFQLSVTESNELCEIWRTYSTAASNRNATHNGPGNLTVDNAKVRARLTLISSMVAKVGILYYQQLWRRMSRNLKIAFAKPLFHSQFFSFSQFRRSDIFDLEFTTNLPVRIKLCSSSIPQII